MVKNLCKIKLIVARKPGRSALIKSKLQLLYSNKIALPLHLFTHPLYCIFVFNKQITASMVT